jgi:hypothetical protein
VQGTVLIGPEKGAGRRSNHPECAEDFDWLGKTLNEKTAMMSDASRLDRTP